MQEALTRFSPGDTIEIEYYRDGKRQNTQAKLRNSRGETGITKASDGNELGATLKSLDKDTARRMQIRGGVVVEKVGDGRFHKAGIRKDFIILGVNGKRVSTPDEFNAIYKSIASSDAGQDKVLFLSGIYPSGKTAYYAVPLDD